MVEVDLEVYPNSESVLVRIDGSYLVTKSKVNKIEENSEPLITLDSNKLILTTGAVDLMQICSDCRIDIKYKKKNKVSVPVIGTDEAFGTKGGNKLTKTNTISFRGASNEKLSEFGTTFKLEPSEDKGIFYMIGDKISNPIPEDSIDIENELDIDSLDDINIDDDGIDLEKFDFTL